MRNGRQKHDEVVAAADGAAEAEGTTEVAVDETGTSPEIELVDTADADDVVEVAITDKSAPEDRAENGPLDEIEANPVRPYVDLGGVKILPREGLQVRLEVEEGSQRIVAVGLDFENSSLQVQPFAAPRSTGLWHEIRAQIAEQIEQQGGEVDEIDGPFGLELRAVVPVVGESGKTEGSRPARFIGVDGPRWFLRGVIAGDAATDSREATEIEELFRSVVVVRGTAPMPPRDLIPLHMPKTAPTSTI